MTTLPPAADTGTLPGHRAAADVRALLRTLGADHELTHRVHSWETLDGEPHVYVPPLPAVLVERLLGMLPSEATL